MFILEEVLATNYAMWWAPDGEHILYAAFNDSVVRDYNFPFYGDYSNVYTDIISIPYPKVMYYSVACGIVVHVSNRLVPTTLQSPW